MIPEVTGQTQPMVRLVNALLVDAVTSLVPTGTQRSSAPPEVEATLPAGWIAGVLSPDPDRLITLLELEPVLAVSPTTDKEQE